MLSFFPLDVFDEIWDVIKSFSEGFLTYSYQYVKYSFVCFLLSRTRVAFCLYIQFLKAILVITSVEKSF